MTLSAPGKDTCNQYSVPPVDRAITLLRYIGNGNDCHNLSKTSATLGINRTTLIRLIHTLLEHRMIEETGIGAGYRLGVGLIGLSAQALQSRDIVRMSQPLLVKLAAETGMSAHLGVLDGTEIIYLCREAPSTHLVSNMHAGSRLPAHASSIGRVILAELSSEQVLTIFHDVDLTPATEKTPVSLDDVLAQCKNDKEQGLAWSVGNFERGIGSCAAPIFDYSGAVVGGLNISGPQDRFADPDTDAADMLRKAVLTAAKGVSLALGYRG